MGKGILPTSPQTPLTLEKRRAKKGQLKHRKRIEARTPPINPFFLN
jgi:hypothetical protein